MDKPALKISVREATLSPRKLAANRENAQLSTGPTSDEGKAISARNNFRHGFTGAFCLLPSESPEDFNQLVADLSEEYAPATVTESILVNDMARHHWLHQRALRMQDECFASDLTAPSTQKQLSLFLRYGVTHERGFTRCLAALLKLRKDKLALERGFESQERERARERSRLAQEQREQARRKEEAAEWYVGTPDELSLILTGVGKDRQEARDVAKSEP